jgi:hypothetical protein
MKNYDVGHVPLRLPRAKQVHSVPSIFFSLSPAPSHLLPSAGGFKVRSIASHTFRLTTDERPNNIHARVIFCSSLGRSIATLARSRFAVGS